MGLSFPPFLTLTLSGSQAHINTECFKGREKRVLSYGKSSAVKPALQILVRKRNAQEFFPPLKLCPVFLPCRPGGTLGQSVVTPGKGGGSILYREVAKAHR
jgi:hypothetical protein